MNRKEQRDSNYELMRIILMFMIVFWHLIINVIFSQYKTQVSSLIWNALHFLLIIHIDTFIILTGYFQSKKEKVGISKILKLNNQAYLYKIIFLVIFLLFNIVTLTPLEIFRIIQPITLYEQYWFISIYILLYLISPYINKLIKNLEKNEYRRLILILLLISSIMPMLTKDLVYNNNKGFSLVHFVLMYLIGGYLNKYPIKESHIFSKLTPSARRLSFTSIYLFFAFLNLLIYYFSPVLSSTESTILAEFAAIIDNMKFAYNNPITIIESIAFFLYFGELKIKSRFINAISALTLDIYLIHDNMLLRSLYTRLNKYIYPNVLGLRYIVYAFVTALAVTITCIIIGYIRVIISKFIKTRKIVININNKLRNKIDSIGIKITW